MMGHEKMETVETAFVDAVEFLNIKDFAERIYNSNSHGELHHIFDYITLARSYKNDNECIQWFRPWFLEVVHYAEKNWQRPESVFQHLFKMLEEAIRAEN